MIVRWLLLGGSRQRVEPHQMFIQPFPIRLGGRNLLLELFVTDDASLLGVHQKHATRLQAALLQHSLWWHIEHADL